MLLPFVFNICGAFCLLVIIIVFEKGFCPSDRFCDQIFSFKTRLAKERILFKRGTAYSHQFARNIKYTVEVNLVIEVAFLHHKLNILTQAHLPSPPCPMKKNKI